LIKKGVSQLNETPVPSDFKILWLHAAGRYGEHNETRFVATLYGRRFLVHTEKERDNRWCYYFDHSEFFRHRESLTAAVVSCEGRCQLCINDLNPGAEKFRNSAFRKIFDVGYVDPREEEANGEAYIVGGAVERSDGLAARAFVAKKYDCGAVQDLDMALLSADVQVRRDAK
jgi:hypothetical protein